MASQDLRQFSVVRARDMGGAMGAARENERLWSIDSLRGRLTELSEEVPSGGLSLTARILAEVQGRGELTAWIGGKKSIFFPPDFAWVGVDLSRLPVIRVEKAPDRLFVIEALLKSQGFALVVVDLPRRSFVSEGDLGRLGRLADLHRSAVLFLTRKRAEEGSLGSGISLRVHAERPDAGQDPFQLQTRLRTVKDKRRKPEPPETYRCHVPRGMY